SCTKAWASPASTLSRRPSTRGSARAAVGTSRAARRAGKIRVRRIGGSSQWGAPSWPRPVNRPLVAPEQFSLERRRGDFPALAILACAQAIVALDQARAAVRQRQAQAYRHFHHAWHRIGIKRARTRAGD